LHHLKMTLRPANQFCTNYTIKKALSPDDHN
jgi:hypothetical protein